MDLGKLFCVLCLILASAHQTSGLYQISEGHDDVTVCPDDYSPRDGCVTLDQLLSDNLIQSNTTFKFVSATFNVQQDVVVRFENVSNITLESAGPHKANITCAGKNSGFVFYKVSGLVVQNVQFIGCGANWTSYYSNCTLGLFESSDVLVHNVAFKHGKGCGVYTSNVYGYLTITHTIFTHMQGPGLSLNYDSNSSESSKHHHNISVAHTRFDSIICCANEFLAFAIEMTLMQQNFTTRINISDVTVTNNTHTSEASGIFVWSTSSNNISLQRYNYTNNYVVGDVYSNTLSGSDFFYTLDGNHDMSNIEIVDSYFVNNHFRDDDQTIDPFSIEDNLYGVLFFFINDYSFPVTVSIRNTVIAENTGWYGAAILFTRTMGTDTMTFEMINITLASNVIYSSAYYKKGTVSVKSASNVKVEDCSIVNNSATGLLIENSNIKFTGVNELRGNRGYNGGGMALYWDSILNIAENATVLFENNLAENVGGGLYVQQGQDNFDINGFCFLDKNYVFDYTASFEFNNNSAVTAGNDWYGGYLHMCNVTTSDGDKFGWKVVTDLVHSPDNYTIDVTSDPLHVCDCSTRSVQDCISVVRTLQTVQTYPGRLFNLSLVAVGQLLNTTTLSGVPSAIYASLLNSTTGTIPQAMQVQTGERTCSELPYRINSANPSEVMVLTVDDNINKIPEYFLMLWQQNDSLWREHVIKLFSHDLTVPAYVQIELLDCPMGFELYNGECNCSNYLMEFVLSCSIDTMLIKGKPPIWLSALNNSHSEQENSTLFLVHKHCPFDYCISGNLEFSLEEPDAQCDHNRSGVLCGQCKSGYSLTLGRMECRQCTNIYLLLLVPFGIAGILLVLFLSLTDMTVTAGTINGLLFFANVVRENQATFFPPQAAGGFLSVFIAWLNLDIGINTCFFNGLDSYVFTWLQLSFPIYIWLLAFSIIVASRHVKFMNKVCGRNILHVLATLFLLSYTKLQRTITTALSFTVVDVSDGNKYFVWLEDGNVHYLQGKHIPLFLVNVLILILIFIPYTLSVTLGPWLQTKTQYRVFRWVQRLRPLFDAYFGPLKDRHRYWTGLLLLFRMILSLISAVNILGDDSVNLLAIITLIFMLLALFWYSGGVYRVWVFSAFDIFFLVNLGMLASVTLYNKASAGSQYAAVSVSVGSAFVAFCLILFYHCLKKLARYAAIKKRASSGPEEFEDNNSDHDDAMLKAIDEDRADKCDDLKFIAVAVN